jgi:hypothetical protein
MQADSPAELWKYPTGHLVHNVAPAEEKDPTAHVEHALAPDRLYLPAGQDCTPEATQNEPAGHITYPDAPLVLPTGAYEPEGIMI